MAFFVNGTRVETGGDQKESCRAATTGNIALTGLQTIDGVSLVADDRVLVKNQTLSENNGIYAVSLSTWNRTSDADTDDEVTAGLLVQIEEGTANADTLWTLSTDGVIVVGTTPISFTRIAPAAASVLAGAGLEDDGFGLLRIASTAAGDGLGGGSGVPLEVNVDAATIEIVADTLQVKDAGIDEDKLAASVAGDGLVGGAGTPLAVNPGDGIQIVTDEVRVTADVERTANKGAASGYAPLDAGSKLPLTNLPLHASTHKGDGTDPVANATTLVSGLMSFSDKSKLDGIESGATADQIASEVPFTPTGGIAATNVQTALAEVDSEAEKLANKNAASGYAGLDATSRIAKAQGHSATVYNDQANTYTAGSKQSVIASTTTAGLNIGTTISDPSSPVAGDVWRSGELLKYRGTSTTYTLEQTSNKNIASGYAGLDGTSRIAKAQGHAATVYNDQANTYTSGSRQTMTPSATTPGFNIGSGITVDPSSPAAGDMWLINSLLVPELKVVTSFTTITLERTNRKNLPLGYAGLDSSTKLSGAQQTYGLIANTAAEGDKVIRKDGSVAFTADQSMGGFKLTSLGTPTAATDAVTKAYADAAIAGLDVKQSAKAATTVDITLSGAQTIDGISVVATDVVLVKNQTLGENNGLYNVAAGAWTRTTDADTSSEIEGMFVFVAQGTTQANTGWYLTTDSIVLGTTSLVYTQFSGPGSFVAGDGIDITGNSISVDVSDIAGAGLENDGSNNLRISTAAAGVGLSGGGGAALAVNVDGSTLEIPVDTLQVKASGITETHLNISVAGAGLSGGGGSALAVNTADASITVNANDIQVNRDPAGAVGLTGSGLKINTDGTTIDISSNAIKVRSSGIAGQLLISDATTTPSWTSLSGDVDSISGTGVVVASRSRTGARQLTLIGGW